MSKRDGPTGASGHITRECGPAVKAVSIHHAKLMEHGSPVGQLQPGQFKTKKFNSRKTMKAKRTSLPIATASLALLCATTFSLQAATYPVTSTNDTGPGSLRALLAFVSNGDVIDL